MSRLLTVRVGQHSAKGRKAVNQDFHGVHVPGSALIHSKGIAVALADGISSSDVSQQASRAAVSGFFEDYYSTPEPWSVKHSVQCVLNAVNSWLYSQTRRSDFRYNLDKGYVCTFSGIVFRSTTAHIFHVGDSRVYELSGDSLEPLTKAHRVQISDEKHYLQRALGMDQLLELDYLQRAIKTGSTFILTTDGIYEFLSADEIASICKRHLDDLDLAAKNVVERAFENGSDDNLTFQIVRIETVPKPELSEIHRSLGELAFVPPLRARVEFDGYRIVRSLYRSARSNVYLAEDCASKHKVVIKVPSVEQQSDSAYLERFLLEEWIARRVNSANVLRVCDIDRQKSYFYTATEYIDGQTLAQWMRDNPRPGLEQVRAIVEQIAKGLQAFHRLEMLHQDLQPDNIMIDAFGTVKIIDFGSTWVAGLEDISPSVTRSEVLGTVQYTAPECFLGEFTTALSDQFSLAVIAYQMLSGRLPYGADVAKARTRAAQRRLLYTSVLAEDREIPAWVDFSLRKALNPEPKKRYEVISEFLRDLRHPNQAFLNQERPPLLKRNPVAFWQGLSACLSAALIYLLYLQLR
ncbi:bifunctional protein-serine/threonine kinase/phosphatase [Agaribacterium haliotis]|uniref:bifunctional protein-serine/threonine kinase/phosphatase n=1 Tax=Agaribacterium haliotis TaxID=2013869 RepID=UPI000BB55476|nr:bifunctional protein-serine/threonine kinase/phosphatase [Agaribacterium haliotis]